MFAILKAQSPEHWHVNIRYTAPHPHPILGKFSKVHSSTSSALAARRRPSFPSEPDSRHTTRPNAMWSVLRRLRTWKPRLRTLEDFILANDVCLLNSGAATYCSPSSGAMSCLDLALCSPAVFTDFKWKVIDNPYGSDHMPALISLTTALHTIPSRPPRWRLHLADWALFTDQASLDKESRSFERWWNEWKNYNVYNCGSKESYPSVFWFLRKEIEALVDARMYRS